MSAARGQVRRLVVVFGDQLDAGAEPLAEMDPGQDRVWMAESFKEATHVWSNRHRIAVFFSAMRHFADELQQDGKRVLYQELEGRRSLSEILAADLEALRPRVVACTLPGEWRVLEGLRRTCEAAGIPLEVYPDRHFLDTPESFREWAEPRKSVRLEPYYREMRKRHGVLMTDEGGPAGGQWNFDRENRESFGRDGPPADLPARPRHRMDALTREVIKLVEARFPDHPGDLETFNWPVTRQQALAELTDFTENRLAAFGRYQDALWTGEPHLYHSLLSVPLNLKLLNPREVVEAAVSAWQGGRAPLAAVEGFVRQVIGWREYVRGIYWWKMPGYRKRNALEAREALPGFYWTGETPYRCLSEVVGQSLRLGYAHHIQRLMITGLYALLLGVDPGKVHEWYLAVYADAVEWVELPNTLGMSQYGDGGLMASKPYAATGKYIKRMSNYCAQCPANPEAATGDRACPFTTLYWDFLMRHRDRLSGNQRLSLQLRNLKRLDAEQMERIRERADEVRQNPSGEGWFS